MIFWKILLYLNTTFLIVSHFRALKDSDENVSVKLRSRLNDTYKEIL